MTLCPENVRTCNVDTDRHFDGGCVHYWRNLALECATRPDNPPAPPAFYGTVDLLDWANTPNGPFKGVSGWITVLPATALVRDWEPGGRDATWIARVDGEKSGETMYCFGCQIRTILAHDVRDVTPNPNILVLT